MLKAGIAVRKITPTQDEPVLLGGYAARDHCAQGVHDDLFAKALYLKTENEHALLISIDVISIMQKQFDAIKAGILESCGIENVIVCATHTHSGPETRIQAAHVNAPWCERMIREAICAAKEAVQVCQPVKIYCGRINVPEVAKNRRGEPNVDDYLTALRIEAASGETIGMMVHYPCHCTVLDASNYLISADYPGYLYEILSEHYDGAPVLFFNGACGNQNIGYSADASALGAQMGSLRTFETAREKAAILAQNAVQILEKAETFINAKGRKKLHELHWFMPEGEEYPRTLPVQEYAVPIHETLKFNALRYEMPLKDDLPTAQELLARIEDCAADPDRALEKIYAQCLYDNITEYETQGKQALETCGAVMQLGTLVLASVPVELFCQASKSLWMQHRKQHVIVLGYANGYYGYLPTTNAAKKGGYECETTVHAQDGLTELFFYIKREIKALLSKKAEKPENTAN